MPPLWSTFVHPNLELYKGMELRLAMSNTLKKFKNNPQTETAISNFNLNIVIEVYFITGADYSFNRDNVAMSKDGHFYPF
jgi:hypothetical protein